MTEFVLLPSHQSGISSRQETLYQLGLLHTNGCCLVVGHTQVSASVTLVPYQGFIASRPLTLFFNTTFSVTLPLCFAWVDDDILASLQGKYMSSRV